MQKLWLLVKLLNKACALKKDETCYKMYISPKLFFPGYQKQLSKKNLSQVWKFIQILFLGLFSKLFPVSCQLWFWIIIWPIPIGIMLTGNLHVKIQCTVKILHFEFQENLIPVHLKKVQISKKLYNRRRKFFYLK